MLWDSNTVIGIIQHTATIEPTIRLLGAGCEGGMRVNRFELLMIIHDETEINSPSGCRQRCFVSVNIVRKYPQLPMIAIEPICQLQFQSD